MVEGTPCRGAPDSLPKARGSCSTLVPGGQEKQKERTEGEWTHPTQLHRPVWLLVIKKLGLSVRGTTQRCSRVRAPGPTASKQGVDTGPQSVKCRREVL